jgi:predicted outer membrane repeat protein
LICELGWIIYITILNILNKIVCENCTSIDYFVLVCRIVRGLIGCSYYHWPLEKSFSKLPSSQLFLDNTSFKHGGGINTSICIANSLCIDGMLQLAINIIGFLFTRPSYSEMSPINTPNATRKFCDVVNSPNDLQTMLNNKIIDQYQKYF